MGQTVAENNVSGRPMVSAVVTTMNRPRLVRAAIASAVHQTHQPMEIIVVSDGPDPELRGWIEQQYGDRVRYIEHSVSRGLSAARNTGLHAATAPYVAFLDDDDQWMPTKIEKQLAMAEQLPVRSFVCCHARDVTPTGSIKGMTAAARSGDVRGWVRKPRVGIPLWAGLFRTSELTDIGGYDENIKSHVDYDLWFTLARHRFSAHFVDECLVEHLDHEGGRLTRNVDLRLEATRLLFCKWQPEFEQWFGVRPGRRYVRQHRAACFAELAFTSLVQGSRGRSARLFLSAIALHPTRAKYYIGLVSSVTHPGVYAAYNRLAWTLRKRFQKKGGRIPPMEPSC